LGADNDWIKMCMDIESRSIQIAKLEVPNAKLLHGQLLQIFNIARNKKILLTDQPSVRKLLKIKKGSAEDEIEIIGGERNFKRRKDLPYFERRDGCWFDFAITLKQTKKSAEVIGFNFEIRFPDNVPVKFLRFDFNLPEHNNEEKGMRFHIHPGYDDFMVNAPPMSPIEILNLFLYGFDIPAKQRNSATPLAQ
jgi:hypothetical protein